MMTFEDLSKKFIDWIRKDYVEIGVQPNSERILVVGFSFDGSWQKCGYISPDGIGCTIGLPTGLPINYEVPSNFCFPQM